MIWFHPSPNINDTEMLCWYQSIFLTFIMEKQQSSYQHKVSVNEIPFKYTSLLLFSISAITMYCLLNNQSLSKRQQILIYTGYSNYANMLILNVSEKCKTWKENRSLNSVNKFNNLLKPLQNVNNLLKPSLVDIYCQVYVPLHEINLAQHDVG